MEVLKTFQKEQLLIKFNIAKDPKYDGYQRGLVSMGNIFLIKRPQAVVLGPCYKMSI